jgi:hypothetical protein
MFGLNKHLRRAGHTTLLAAAVAGSALTLGLSTAAHADYIVSQTFPDTVPDSGDGLFQNGSAQVGFTYTGPGGPIGDGPGQTGEPAQAGQFTVTITNTATNTSKVIQAYCGDIFNFLSLPATYQQMTLNPNDPKTKLLNALLGAGNQAVNNTPIANRGIASAALQLAIWEVQNETTGTLDVTTGDFQADQDQGATDPGVIAAANQDLANIEGSNPLWADNPALEVEFLIDDASQGLLYLVPEPTGVAVFGASLLGLGLLRRRKRA